MSIDPNLNELHNFKITELSNPNAMRQSNWTGILTYIRAQGPQTRSELTKNLSLSPAAVSTITKELIQHGCLVEKKVEKNESQRAGRFLYLNPSKAYTLGVSIYGDKDTLALHTTWADYSGTVHDGVSLTTPRYDNVKFIDDLLGALNATIDKVPDSSKIKGLVCGLEAQITNNKVIASQVIDVKVANKSFNQLRTLVNYPIKVMNSEGLSVENQLRITPKLISQSFAVAYFSLSNLSVGIAIRGERLGLTKSNYTGSVTRLLELDPPYISNFAYAPKTINESLSHEFLVREFNEININLAKLSIKIIEDNSEAALKLDDYCENLLYIFRIIHLSIDIDLFLIDYGAFGVKPYKIIKKLVENKIKTRNYPLVIKSAKGLNENNAASAASYIALAEALHSIELR